MEKDYLDALFLRVREQVSRNAGQRWVKLRGLKEGMPGYEAALADWRRLPLLGDTALQQHARQVLEGSLGRTITTDAPFPAMLWYGGATDSHEGVRFKGTFLQFVEHVIVARSNEIAAKRSGWVVTPTSNMNGWRGNASTTAMHALNLDCDNNGDWTKILTLLDALDMAYIAYQSGGWTPTTPKWHLLIPLAQPFDTTTTEKIKLWKALYAHCRVVFGALAELVGDGFDPTVEAPSVPVFITERRNASDPLRQVVWRTGRTLDLMGIAALLPIPEEAVEQEIIYGVVPVEAKPLGNEQLDRIIESLVEPMSKILSSRRDLYLALPGALLDRGIVAEDVMSIVDEVSRRCPGDPRYTSTEISDRHREHVHCAQTTISKFETGDLYTRIGTIATNWPSVAHAIDDVLPDPKLKGIRDLVDKMSGRTPPSSAASAIVTLSPATAVTPSIISVPVEVPIDLDALRKRLVNLKKAKLKSPNIYQKVRGFIIESLLNGEDLVPFIELADGTKKSIEDANEKIIDCNGAVKIAMGLIAFKLPPGTPFSAVVELARRSLYATAKEHGQSFETICNRAEHAFLRSFGARVELDDQKFKQATYDRLDRLG
jgi:hypothetical protein